MNMKKSVVSSSIALAIGLAIVPPQTSATTYEFTWSGYYSLIDSSGAAVANSSLTTKGANQYETPMTGTLTYDTATGTGSATFVPTSFMGASVPFSCSPFTLQSVGNGIGGPGDLIMVNTLCTGPFSIYTGQPVSFVWDASGLFNALSTATVGTVISGVGVRPAVDGTYVGSPVNNTHLTSGYMNLGIVPLATTKYDTTPLCVPGGGGPDAPCMNVLPSGGLPLITDTVVNTHDYNAVPLGGDGSLSPGIGGSPKLAGGLDGYNDNYNITTLTVTCVGVCTTVDKVYASYNQTAGYTQPLWFTLASTPDDWIYSGNGFPTFGTAILTAKALNSTANFDIGKVPAGPDLYTMTYANLSPSPAITTANTVKNMMFLSGSVPYGFTSANINSSTVLLTSPEQTGVAVNSMLLNQPVTYLSSCQYIYSLDTTTITSVCNIVTEIQIN